VTRRGALLAALAAILGVTVSGCGGDPAGRPTATIRLATTTSARDTGLLDLLLPAFRRESGIEVQPIAVGTGEALKYGERGDADVVLVHSRKAEDAFVARGFGVERKDVWWNRFLLVGPRSADPSSELVIWTVTVGTNMARAHPVIGHDAPAAHLLGEDGIETSPRPASLRVHMFLSLVADRKWAFVSRGDDSGTHKRETELWGPNRPTWSGYLETGQGMGPTLTIADEKGAYTLTDEGTYLRMRKKLRLESVIAEDAALRNPYGAILVRPGDPSSSRADAARRFYDWLASEACRAIVRGLVIDGHRAFFLPDEPATGALRGRLDLDSPPR
jgi:tungstate transport system substrate-binding protein